MGELNVVKIAEDKDFNDFRQLCDNNDGWDLVYSKKSAKVFTKETSQTSFKVIKVINRPFEQNVNSLSKCNFLKKLNVFSDEIRFLRRTR